MTSVLPSRVALVGIDGSGKTSIARRLRELTSGHDGIIVVHAIRPHETPDGPLQALSWHLHALSEAADRLRSPELKVAAFYLLLTSYAPIEQFFANTLRPRVLVADRHPLVDTLVYLPLYGRAAAARPGHERRPPRGWAYEVDPQARTAAVTWARRVGCKSDLWSFGREILALHTQSPDRMLGEFRERFQTELPERIVLLDLDVEEALDRLRDRGRAKELHETRAQLTALRLAYEETLDWLATNVAGISVDRVTTGGRPVDAAVEEIVSTLPAVDPTGCQRPCGQLRAQSDFPTGANQVS